MPKATFTLPEGILLDASNGTLDVRYDGNVVLETTMGLPLGEVSVGGDLTLPSCTAANIEVGGALKVNGELGVQSLKAESIDIAGDVTADTIISEEVGVQGSVKVSALESNTVFVSGTLEGDSIRCTGHIDATEGVEATELRAASLTTHTMTALKVSCSSIGIAGDAAIANLKAGDASIGGSLNAEHVHASGELSVGGNIKSTRILVDKAVLSGSIVDVRALSANRTVQIGIAKVTADVIMAPQLDIAPGATGRVKILESKNDRAANKIKGGFSLADYDDMFGDASSLLEELGVPPMGTNAPEELVTTASPVPQAESGIEAVTIDDIEPDVELEEEDDEEIDDPLSLSLEDLEPIPEPQDDPLQIQLHHALERVVKSYSGNDLPPAVEELQGFVSSGDVDGLRRNIIPVWNRLVGYHQQHGTSPGHQAAYAFKAMHGLLNS